MIGDSWVWFDLENTPHVLFLAPLIRRVVAAGVAVRVTAKPQGQTLELAAASGLSVEVIGGGEHVGHLRKIAGGLNRARSLARWASAQGKPALLVHSSRTASLAAWWLGLPAVGLLDYEHAEHRALAVASGSLWFPDLLERVALPRRTRRVARFYAGLKENLYLDGWELDRERERIALEVSADQYLVVSRPPADSAHYASVVSDRIWLEAVRHLLTREDSRILVLPRSTQQRSRLGETLRSLPRTTVLERTVIGPALIVAADLVLSGGGTMNREAAVLGTPAWSVFAGPTPHIDERLAQEGRLRWIRSDAELASARAADRPARLPRRGPFPQGIEAIAGDIDGWMRRAREHPL